MSERPEHRVVKEQVAQRFQSDGYDTTVEKELGNGMIIDVVAESKEESIAVEIGKIHGKDRKDVLSEKFDEFVHIPLDEKKDENPISENNRWKRSIHLSKRDRELMEKLDWDTGPSSTFSKALEWAWRLELIKRKAVIEKVEKNEGFVIDGVDLSDLIN